MIILQKGLFKGNGRLTQYFGSNASAYAKFGLKGHNGIDYGIPNGTELYSAIKGKVTEVANDVSGYGKYVKIENDEAGIIYGHLQEWKVKVGDVVKAGQLIGLSNNSGNSTGPHLHFGVFPKPRNRNNGYAGYIDPFDKKLVTWVNKLDEASTTGETPIYIEFSPSKKLPDDFYKINEFKKLKDRKIVKGDEAFDTLMSILLTTDEDRNRAIAELEEQKKHFDEEVEALNKKRKSDLKEQEESFKAERKTYTNRIKELEGKLSISNNDMAKKEIGSPAFSINKTDAKKWGKNTLIFLAPVLLSALLTLVNEIPKEATWGIIALFVVNVAIDLVRKFIRDNSK